MVRSHILVCGGTGCHSSGSDKLIEIFETELKNAGLGDEVKVIKTGCFGLCALGPVVVISPWQTSAHVPAEQTSPTGHAVAQAPQCCASLARLTQVPPQLVRLA